MTNSATATGSVGIIGLGRMGARFIQAAELAGLKLVALLDRAERPWAIGERPDLASIHTMDAAAFWARQPNLVVVATTGPSHLSYMLEGLQHGARRFVIEKPLCTCVRDGQEALHSAELAGARVVVNHGRRYAPVYDRLMQLDGDPRLGALRSASITLGAGGLGCVGIHYIELLVRLFGGLPQKVVAVGTGTPPSNPRGPEFNDLGAAALLIWPQGQRAFVEVADDTGIPPIVELRYTFGRVTIHSEEEPWQLTFRDSGQRDLPLTRYGAAAVSETMADFQSHTIVETSKLAMLDALGEGPAISSPQNALDAVEVFTAIRLALAGEKAISLPLDDIQRASRFDVP